jgi:cytochrome c556
MKHLLAAVTTAAACLTALPAAAQFQKPEDAIKYRQSAFTLLATHFGRVAAMAQGKIPFDAKAAAANGAVVGAVVALPFTAFGEGTDKGRPNRAKPEVWKDSGEFKEHADDLQGAASKFVAATQGGNLDEIKAAAGAMGKACKSCHDEFRAENYSN